MKMTMGV